VTRALGRPESDAERLLYERYRPLVLGFVARRLHSLEEAEAVTHEVFVRAIAHLREGGDVDRLAGWLLAVARHLVIDRVRRAGAAERSQSLLVSERFEPALEGLDLHRLRRALAALPEELRQVLTLKYEEELSFAEIGSRLGLSKNAVFARHQRGIDALRARFDPPEGGSS
jgi:RNA polymerase sigma-70 factor (ECF subfamily)